MGREKTINTAFRILPSEKSRLEAVAEGRKMNFTDLLLEGARMLSEFSPYFLEEIRKIAQRVGLSVPKVIQQLLTAYIAADAAVLEVFGTSKIYQRAFQFDKEGLITGDRLSALVLEQTKDDAKAVLDKLIQCHETGETVRISREEATLLVSLVNSRIDIKH